MHDHPNESRRPSEGEAVLPLHEEKAVIEKRRRATGKVRVRTKLDTQKVLERAELVRDRVEVERVPMDQVVTTPPAVRTEGDVTIIPVLEERLVVEKQLVLVEEVRLRRVASAESVEVPVTLRKQEAIVEREDYSPPRAPKIGE